MSIIKHMPLAILTSLIDYLLSPILFPRRHLKLLAKVDMPAHHREAAKRSFDKAKQLDKQIGKHKLRAPFVMAKVVPKLAWDAEHLPAEYAAYDNERGLNGDSSGWVFDPVLGYEVPAKAPIADTAEARATCYYAKGNHPRSAAARYIWLGRRNRASKLAHDLGPERSQDLEQWGDYDTSGDNPGILVRRMGDHYEIFATEHCGPFVIRTRYGYKIGNTVGPRPSARAMVVTIPFSVKLK
jgi:hypothetical protein